MKVAPPAPQRCEGFAWCRCRCVYAEYGSSRSADLASVAIVSSIRFLSRPSVVFLLRAGRPVTQERKNVSPPRKRSASKRRSLTLNSDSADLRHCLLLPDRGGIPIPHGGGFELAISPSLGDEAVRHPNNLAQSMNRCSYRFCSLGDATALRLHAISPTLRLYGNVVRSISFCVAAGNRLVRSFGFGSLYGACRHIELLLHVAELILHSRAESSTMESFRVPTATLLTSFKWVLPMPVLSAHFEITTCVWPQVRGAIVG